MTQPLIHEPAPAKINLFLHVTGQRTDGYHELDTLVGFASICDSIEVCRASDNARPETLEITGRFASAIPLGPDNLVLKAAALLRRHAAQSAKGRPPLTRIILEKNLPPASGIGGGSADAAATLRVLNRFWQLELSLDELIALSSNLGADIALCLHSRMLRALGIGDQIKPVSGLPVIPAVLVNAGINLETPTVFEALEEKSNAPALAFPSAARDQNTLIEFLATCRNDLQAPAIKIVPEINEVLSALARQQGCKLARMSGSGATCFGLFEKRDAANRAAEEISGGNPGWWVASCGINSEIRIR